MHVLKKVLLTGGAAAAVVLSLIAGVAQAKVVKISIVRTQTVDPETGAFLPVVSNPSGDVDVTFTASGFQLEFRNIAGKLEAIQIHSDYTRMPMAPPKNAERFNQLFGQILRKSGRVFPGQIVTATAENMAAVPEGAAEGYQPTPLQLIFHHEGRVGFVPSFRLIDVTMVLNGESVTIEDAIYRQLSGRVIKMMVQENARMVQENIRAAQEIASKFESDSRVKWVQGGAGGSCSNLFAAVSP